MRILILALIVVAVAGPAVAQTGDRPLVIGHRGASGYLPDHTLEAYTLAAEQGADYIEADFVVSKDGYMFARHEMELSISTNVATTFPDRKTKKVIEGREVEGWFSEDFTHDEIKLLRAVQPLPFRNQKANLLYQIPTVAEVLALRARLSRELGRSIGIYIELKNPEYFTSINLPMEEGLAGILKAWAMDRPGSPIFVESFETPALRKMARYVPAVPVVQLLADGVNISDQALKAMASYAFGIGPSKTMVVPRDTAGGTGAPTDLIARAHAAGLKVHAYTFRPEKQFLPATYGGDPAKEYCQFVQLGVDGLFTDTPDLALKALKESCPMPR